jgi:hypothetical protein
LINGQSVFGVTGGRHPTIDLGVVVVDDAHAALATTEGQFRLTIPAQHPATRKLFDLFRSAAEGQSQKAWLDMSLGEPGAASRVPFWAWADMQSEVRKILHPHQHDPEFAFAWPLITDCLSLCTAMLSSGACT